MAKRKRAKRRRVGAKSLLNPGSPALKLMAVAGGYLLAADPLNNALDGVLSKVFKKPAGADGVTPAGVSDMGNYAAIAGEGFGAYMLLKSRGSLIKTVAGGLLAGAALKRALKKFGVISGYQRVPVIGAYQSVPVIGQRSFNALPEALNGYRVNGPGVGGYNVNGRNQSVMGAAASSSTSASDLLG